MQQEDFRATFTTAERWGRFTQKVVSGRQSAGVEMRYGKLLLKELVLGGVEGTAAKEVKVELDGRPVDVSLCTEADRCVTRFDAGVTIHVGHRLEFFLS